MQTHGSWCNSFAYPTRCWHCGNSIYFFGCACGSRVLFDDLGIPWPKHLCAQGLIARFGFSRQQVDDLVRRRARELEVDVPRVDHLFQEGVTKARHASPAILKVAPAGHAHVIGIIRDIVPTVDPRKRLRVEPNTIGDRQLLRYLPTTVIQITVLVGGNGATQASSYTGWVQPGSVSGFISVGRIVEADFSCLSIPGLAPIWIIDELIVVDER